MNAFDPRKNPKANENVGMLLAVIGAILGAAVTNVDPIWTIGLAVIFALAGYFGAPYLVEGTAPTPTTGHAKEGDGHAKEHGDEHHDDEPGAPTPPKSPAKAKTEAKVEPEEDPEVTRLKAQIAAKDAENQVLREGIQKVAKAAKPKEEPEDGEKPKQQGQAPRPKAIEATPNNVVLRLDGLENALMTHLQKGVTEENIRWLRQRVYDDRNLLQGVPEATWPNGQRREQLQRLQRLERLIRDLKIGDKTKPEPEAPPSPPTEEEGTEPKGKIVELLENPVVQAAATAAATTLVKAAKKKISKKA